MIKSTILKSLRHMGLALTTCTMLGIAMSQAAVALKYSVTDIGTLGGSSSRAYGINDSGQVVGVSSLRDTDPPKAFAWDSTNGIQALPSATPNFSTQAYGINNNGLVVGYEFSDAGDPQAILWNINNRKINGQLLGFLDDTESDLLKSVAYAINDNGLVVGASASLPDKKLHAVLWNTTNVSQKNAQAILNTDKFGSVAYGINNNGQVVVSSGGGFQALILDTRTGVSQSLLSLRGNCEPYGINNKAQVAGFCRTGDTTFVGAQWNSPKDVQSLGGNLSIAYGINDNGQVVGSINNGQRAFLWENGVASDLNNNIDTNSGWILKEARAINNRGQIAGTGQINGQTHAFLLTPQPARSKN
ncbi:MAG: DUF3466 family protein [Stigonema ocellatum SAG 48.90 = DSM 106950]|nr:DUF3466 family protein [Stigonema ocellatum SAG 48.90 = DSM 106950]